jgi:polysaccharide export outer membrane protein
MQKKFFYVVLTLISTCIFNSYAAAENVEQNISNHTNTLEKTDPNLQSKIGTAGLDYHMGILDLIEIKVLYADDLGRTLRIDSRGNISLPLVGEIHAAGLTSYELEQTIARKLATDYVQNPQVTVFIKEFTSQRMTIQGVVSRAGVYEIAGQASLLQALSMAGGLMDKGDESAIKVIRKRPGEPEQTLTFDMNEIRENRISDPNLENGDIVLVEEKKPISVQGAVKTPGIYYLRGKVTLMQALSQAGGDDANISDKGDVRVTTTKPNGTQVTVAYDIADIQKGKATDPQLMPGDLVVVTSSTFKSITSGITNTIRGFIGFKPI